MWNPSSQKIIKRENLRWATKYFDDEENQECAFEEKEVYISNRKKRKFRENLTRVMERMNHIEEEEEDREDEMGYKEEIK